MPTLLGEASVIRKTLSRDSRRLAERIGRLIIFASRAFDVGSSPMTPRKLSPRPHTTSSISRTNSVWLDGGPAALAPQLNDREDLRKSGLLQVIDFDTAIGVIRNFAEAVPRTDFY